MLKHFLFLALFLFTAPHLFANQLDSIPLLFQQGIHEIDHVSYTVKEGDREMTVQFWYPSDMIKASEAKAEVPIFDKRQFSSLLQRQQPFPKPKAGKSFDIRQQILDGGEVDRPVLVFYSNLGLDRLFTVSLYERLASNGFVIIEIDLPEIGFSAA
ncbi:MAG TPA: hypothetical protein VJ953_20795 [Saprospiraceae bacterium]|nr:hypothetical protein [Saprospiraceae bacterium]